MKYKKYPKYKDSGVEWIGEIPEEWQVKKLKFILDMPVSDGPHETPVFQDSGIPFFSVDNIQNNKLFLEKLRFITKEDHKRFSLKCKPQKNDLLLGKAASVGKIALVDLDSEFNVWSPLAVIRVSQLEMLPKFCYFMFRSDFLQLQISLKVNWNTQGNIGIKDIENLKIIIPSKIEQEQIINFLDKNTTQFDKLITKSKAQVTLLEEKRQATINQAVTKGLDPSVKMKDSGVEWIGKIPEGWEVRPVRYLLNAGKSGIRIGPFGSSLKLEMMKDSGFKIYGQENVIDDDFSKGHRFIGEEKFLEMKNYEIFPNDIVITMMGTTGKSKTVPDNIQQGIMDSHLVRMRTNQNICHPKLFSLILNDASYVQSQLTKLSNGSIMQGLNSQIIKSVKIILPPIDDQEKIFDFIQHKKVQFDELIAKSKKQITILEEKRQALITAAVTGKIDVRDSVVA